MRYVFQVDVEVNRTQGKFASKDEISEAIVSEIDGSNPGSVSSGEGAEYEITDLVRQASDKQLLGRFQLLHKFQAQHKLILEAERIKILLSSNSTAFINLSFIYYYFSRVWFYEAYDQINNS